MAKYRRQEKIDSGGFGCVYRASCNDDGQIYAFKVLESPDLNDEDKKRFAREVRIQSQLEHPHIVPVVGSNLSKDPPFFVMPLAAGTLRTKISDGTYDGDVRAAIGIFNQLLDGMEYAHANGVIHRDLKPENVLFFEEDIFGDDIARIADFGLGKRMDTETLSVTQSYVGMGTAAYMPPEQYVDFKRVDERADIYSLGKMLYELLTGELPLHVDQHHSSLPKGYGYVVGRCLEHDPGRRYQTIVDLKKDILELASDQRKFQHPQQEVEKLKERIENEGDTSEETIEKIDRIFAENDHDEAFYSKHFVDLGTTTIELYLEYSEGRFIERFEIFDGFLTGGLPFGFTDRVANFYERVWGATSITRIRRTVLERLLDMGHSHNRWHVGEVFGRVIASIQDQELGMLARDVLLSSPSAASWMQSYCKGGTLSVIREGFSPTDET